MVYYSRYTTGNKCVMLGFSLLQLVTSKPGAVAIPKAQLTQSLPCSFHVPATQHGIASVYPTPTRHDLPPVTIMIHPGVSQRIPPLFRHVMGAGTDPHIPTASFGQSSAWHLWPCTKTHLRYEVSAIGRCFPLNLVSRASCILPWLVSQRISYPPTKRFLHSNYLDLLFPDRGTMYRFLPWIFLTPKSQGEISIRGDGCNILDV
jgi:hypothetical protein